MTLPLFPDQNTPRVPRRKLMHVADAGRDMVRLQCPHCGHDTGWIPEELPVSAYKRGIPCPKCNVTEPTP